MKKPSRITFQERLQHMVDTLRSQILSGQYPPDSYIPSILQLSEDFKLSINSVQKGLDLLVEESLVERIPRVGVRVKETVADRAVTLSIGYYTTLINEMDLGALVQQFEAAHSSVKVNLVPLHFGDYVEVTENYLKNEMVDAVAINHINYSHFVHQYGDIAELFEPLDPTGDVYPYLTEAFSVNGQLFVQPVIFSPVVLCYNKSYFMKHQMPELPMSWQWSDFMRLLDRLESETEAKLGFYFYPSTWNRWPVFILQSGVDFRNAPADWGAPAIMDGIEACYRLIHRQNTFSLLLSSNETSVEELFLQQHVPVMMTTYFRLNQLKEAPFAFDVAPLPYVHAPKTLLLPIGFAVNRYSRKKAAARAFIDFMASYDTQLHIRQNTYTIPAMRQAAEWNGPEPLYRPANFHLYKEISDQFSLLSDLRLSEKELEKLIGAMNMYWSGIHTKEETRLRLAEIGQPGE